MPNALGRFDSESESLEIEEYIMGTGRLSDCPALSSKEVKDAGFDSKVLSSIESKLQTSSTYVPHSHHQLGKKFCTDILGLTEAQLNDPFFDTLGSLGFTAEDIEAANDHIFGHNTIEGASD